MFEVGTGGCRCLMRASRRRYEAKNPQIQAARQRQMETVSGQYLRLLAHLQTGSRNGYDDPTIAAAKRDQVLLKRTIKELKHVTKERIAREPSTQKQD